MRLRAATLCSTLAAVIICGAIVSGCYVRKEIMLRNPRYVEPYDSATAAQDNADLMTSPDGMYSMPPGYEEHLLPARPGTVWKLTDSHPNRLKTIYYDASKEVNPIGYAIVGDKMNVLLARDYEYGTFQIDMARIDSIWAYEADYGKGETVAKVSVLASLVGLIVVLCTTVE